MEEIIQVVIRVCFSIVPTTIWLARIPQIILQTLIYNELYRLYRAPRDARGVAAKVELCKMKELIAIKQGHNG